MRAILSDIHANLEALTAVLADIERQGIRSVYNLGDTLGYGPNPIECLDLTMPIGLNLRGMNDQLVLGMPSDWSTLPEPHLLWTQRLFDTTEGRPPHGARGRFLVSLPTSHREDEILYVHGSPRNAQREYVFPEDIYNLRKMGRLGGLFDALCFMGKTHVAGLFLHIADEQWEYVSPEACADGFDVTGRKVMCNVGSVGQPRDGDSRACYVTFDGSRIRFHRVEYDVEATIRKIYAIPEIANSLWDRLREGR